MQSCGGLRCRFPFDEQLLLCLTPAALGVQRLDARCGSGFLIRGRFRTRERFFLLGLCLTPGQPRLGQQRAGAIERAVQINAGDPAGPIPDRPQVGLRRLSIGRQRTRTIEWEKHKPAVPEIVRPACPVRSLHVASAVQVDDDWRILLDKVN